MDPVEKLISERGKDYGDPADDFLCVQRMYKVWTKHAGEAPDFDFDVRSITNHAVYMLLVKLARLAVSHRHKDSWDDIEGYARCAKVALGLQPEASDPGAPASPVSGRPELDD